MVEDQSLPTAARTIREIDEKHGHYYSSILRENLPAQFVGMSKGQI